MNYRHGFHAGGWADCVKHAILLALLDRMRRKDAPFFALDTHAGTGRTPLAGAQAERTGEWRAGIGRLMAGAPGPLAPLLAVLRANGLDAGRYPGSPLLIRARLRAGDRMACCELHGEDAAALRANLAGDARCAVHRRDGWEAVRALLPPRGGIGRGVVLIDPPFEAVDEWEKLAGAIGEARRRFPSGIVAAWYPIKGRAPARGLADAVRDGGVADAVAYEFLQREPVDAARLNGCGMLVANNPWGFEDEAATLLEALAAPLGENGPATVRIARLSAERAA